MYPFALIHLTYYIRPCIGNWLPCQVNLRMCGCYTSTTIGVSKTARALQVLGGDACGVIEASEASQVRGV